MSLEELGEKTLEIALDYEKTYHRICFRHWKPETVPHRFTLFFPDRRLALLETQKVIPDDPCERSHEFVRRLHASPTTVLVILRRTTVTTTAAAAVARRGISAQSGIDNNTYFCILCTAFRTRCSHRGRETMATRMTTTNASGSVQRLRIMTQSQF